MADPSRKPPGEHERRRPPWAVPVVAVLVLVLALIAYAFFTGNDEVAQRLPGPPAPSELSGDGDQTTEPFEIGDGWKIDWSHSSENFAIAITGDRAPGTVVDRFAPGSGSTPAMDGGTFGLEIKADGRWTIRIVQPQ